LPENKQKASHCGPLSLIAPQYVGAPSVDHHQTSRLSDAANRGTITDMDWHPTPKDDAWRQAHLAMLERLGKDVWLRCDGCAHTVMVKPRDFAERHGLDMLTPMLTISRRMRCTRCGAGRAAVDQRRMTRAAKRDSEKQSGDRRECQRVHKLCQAN
jgi:DNA-directed RNA polymerase subunit RPC12/RpoP